MKYENLLLTTEDYNEKVSGVKKVYDCWSISYKKIDEITDYEPCVILLSIAIPTLDGKVLIRKYLSIGFFVSIDEIKKTEAFKNCKDVYFIPINSENHAEIIKDINEKQSIYF